MQLCNMASSVWYHITTPVLGADSLAERYLPLSNPISLPPEMTRSYFAGLPCVWGAIVSFGWVCG